MRRLWLWRGNSKWLVLGLLVLLAAGVWWYRTPLLCQYHLHNLASASDADRQRCVDAVVSLDAEALPGLFDLLRREDARTCANAEAVLSALLRHWGPEDGRTQALLLRVEQEFATWSICGQQAVLELYLVRLRPEDGPPAPVFVQAAGRLLSAAARPSDAGVRTRALALAEVLVEFQPKENLDVYRTLVRKGLADDHPDNRVRAVHLTLHSALRQEADLSRSMVPLLRDRAVKVRRAALLALSMEEEAVTAEDLMPLLHDADPDVRKLCEHALVYRKLSERHIQLARLFSDPQATARLDVLDVLRESEDVEPGVWLRRLSQDSEKAVRAAAARAAAGQSMVDLSDRLQQMSQDDPSPTVRQLTGYYLRLRKQR